MLTLLLSCTAPHRRPLWRALLLALLVVITWLALSPKPPEAMNTGWDKANHLLAFGCLAFAATWAIWPRPRLWGWLVLALLAYGVGIELAQSLLPPRSADWRDVLADALGIAVGLLAAWPIASRSPPG
ncbi:MAG: VanZ family protein [Roseateles sp.]